MLYNNDIDVCAISETWLSDDIMDAEFTPDGYVCFHKDRKLSYYHEGCYTLEDRGGVLLLVKSNLNPTPYEYGDVDAEIVWVEIHPDPKTSIVVGAAYRPERGGAPNLDKICNSINAVATDNVILMGDLNFRDITWDSLEASTDLSQKFLDCLEDNMWTQCVHKSTCGNNILDLVLTGNTDIIQKVDVDQKFVTSDHRMCFVTLSVPVPRINLALRKVYLYSKGDYESFSDEIRSADWNTKFEKKTLNQKWDAFKDVY